MCGWGGLRSSVQGEVELACSHVRGRPILPAAPKLLLVYLLGGHKHQGFTGERHREHGGLPNHFGRPEAGCVAMTAETELGSLG